MRVIEPDDQPVRLPDRRLELSPQQALYYNTHAGAILEDFEPREYKAVLRAARTRSTCPGQALSRSTRSCVPLVLVTTALLGVDRCVSLDE